MNDVDPRPIRLVYCDEKGKFHMDPEAVSILKRLKGPIAVVSVWGPTHHGKSFLLNQLLGRTTGFPLGLPITLQGCTEGLWMWSTPSKETAADGTEYNLLLIDMEGIDACAQVVQYVYLALVLSSMSIYNQMGLIHETSLYLLCDLIAIADINAGDATASEFFPIFVWLLRDFTVALKRMSPNEYMESALKQGVTSDRQGLVNKIRKSLQDVFVERHCYTLVRPSSDAKELLALDQIPINRLRPQFTKEMDKFKSFVIKNTKPKKIGATVMTGPEFVQITKDMLKAFNSGTLPLMAQICKNVEKTNRPKAWKSVVDNLPAANTRKRKRSIRQKDVGAM